MLDRQISFLWENNFGEKHFIKLVRRSIARLKSYRMYASISFVGILIIVGMPLWWKTTEVYRVSLPYARIAKLEELPIKILINIEIAFYDKLKSKTFADELQKSLIKNSDIYDLNIKSILHPKLSESFSEDNDTMLRCLESRDLNEDIYVSNSRDVLFSSRITVAKLCEIIEDWLLNVNSIRSIVASMSTAIQQDAAGRRRMPPSKAFDISLSVVVPHPDKIKVTWDPKMALENYVEPFLKELKLVHNFTLKSQWLYFVQLDVNPKQVQDNTVLKRHYALSEDLLPHLITPLEKKLASHISKHPCLNFVLYVPACEHSPIHIYDKHGKRINGILDAFLSPRWGGVVIGNPDFEMCFTYLNDSTNLPIYNPPTKEIMGYVLSQLRLLLGIQNLRPHSNVEIEPLKTMTLRSWELDTLIRIRTVEQVLSARLTLQSLSQLLVEISNIVINDEVGASIHDAVKNIEITIDYLKNGKHAEALISSREAFLSAEAAFTDPSLLALLYFPDDQKYAVYIPLFLPVMIPVIISFKNIWSWLKCKLQSKEKTE